MPIYKKLSVWRKAHELALRVFRVTAPLYSMRQSYLAGQMRRAASSIPANIAEGSGRSTSAQFAQFLQQSLGSARELDYHLLLARDLDLISPGDHATLEARIDEVTKMLVALRRTVANRPPTGRTAKAHPRPSPLAPPSR
ncbi:MAG: four helix bundle protein [Gemmatimonadaceae bacterium]